MITLVVVVPYPLPYNVSTYLIISASGIHRIFTVLKNVNLNNINSLERLLSYQACVVLMCIYILICRISIL